MSEAQHQIPIAGRHSHTCVNPHGVVHTVRCFREAWNLREVGPPTTYFSWFAGYAWSIVHCAGCDAHLGWAFDGDEDRFYGFVAACVEG